MNLKKAFHFEKTIRFDFWNLKRKDKPTPTSQHHDQDQSPAPLPPPAIPTVHDRATSDDASSLTTADQNKPPTITVVETATVQPNNEGDNPSSGGRDFNIDFVDPSSNSVTSIYFRGYS
ncbi:hypothetical protein AN958_06918 [Leucoagaricus sp. SymC.cos]|nr:hypothetical protein AN958_06918 [Leucoagaricus sp. SymC.cos]